METLNSKQEAFIQMMKTDADSERQGFELLADYPNLDIFFDKLLAEGFFSPQNNPPITSVPDQPGLVQVPYWPALMYLLAAAKFSEKKSNLELAQKILNVIRNVGSFREEDGSVRDNHITNRIFADIFGFIPSSLISKDDIGLIKAWLESKFDHGMVAHTLNKGIFQKLCKSESPEDWEKACDILRFCTAVRRVDKERSTSLHAYEPVVKEHWLRELFKENVVVLATKAPVSVCRLFVERLREVFDDEERRGLSYLWRPAIDDHAQNHSWNEPENVLVVGLRNTLLEWIDRDIPAASADIGSLLMDTSQILRRIGIYLLDKKWDFLKDYYPKMIGPSFLEHGHLHEVYNLLRNHFEAFSEAEKAATLEAIKQLPLPKAGEDSDLLLRLVQRNWLSAIVNKGYDPADTLYQKLSSDPALGQLREHPDFHSYMHARWGPGPSPFRAEELVAFAEQGKLIEKLNNFQQLNQWEGPNKRALTDALEDAVKLNPKLFLGILPDFLPAKRTFQYGIISGFKKLWDSPKEVDPTFDWDHVWKELISFFEKLILPASFWTEKIEEPDDIHLTANRNWIPPIISDFLQAGTRDDNHAYSADLLPRGWRLIEVLLDNSEAAESPAEDAVTQALNTQKGRAIEALFLHALRACRVGEQTDKEHVSAWATMEPAFDKELEKCKNGNYEFSTFLGHYMAHLDYMSHDWLVAHIEQIFPEEFHSNYECALKGLAYASATTSIYSLLDKKGILDLALRKNIQGPQLRENLIQRMALAYLWGQETLQSSRFKYFFDTEALDDLEIVALFFWGISGREITEIQVNLILEFWRHCSSWKFTRDPAKLFSALSRLSCYLNALGDSEMELLTPVAPYVYVDNNADNFIEELNRLADDNPSNAGKILEIVLKRYTPMFDFEDRLKALLLKIHNSGGENKILAITLVDKLRSLPGMPELYNTLSGD